MAGRVSVYLLFQGSQQAGFPLGTMGKETRLDAFWQQPVFECGLSISVLCSCGGKRAGAKDPVQGTWSLS